MLKAVDQQGHQRRNAVGTIENGPGVGTAHARLRHCLCGFLWRILSGLGVRLLHLIQSLPKQTLIRAVVNLRPPIQIVRCNAAAAQPSPFGEGGRFRICPVRHVLALVWTGPNGAIAEDIRQDGLDPVPYLFVEDRRGLTGLSGLWCRLAYAGRQTLALASIRVVQNTFTLRIERLATFLPGFPTRHKTSRHDTTRGGIGG